MSFNQVIKGTIYPKVPLKTLSEVDTSSESKSDSSYKAPSYLPDAAQRLGANIPFIKIAGQIVTDIDKMTIDETGFIPTISLTFIDNLGEFAGDYFPKTNLIMSVYLKTASEKFKPIRCDFLITNVKSIAPEWTGQKRGYGIGTTYIVSGELYIPNIYNNISKSYSKLNSKDALKKICSELGLGFAENECYPNDAMTWINTNMSSLKFMQTILSHAYQNDDAFFMGFIDKYYMLNYIEVNQQLKAEDIGLTFLNAANPLMPDATQKLKEDATAQNLQNVTTINYLTTELQFKGKANYVHEISLLSDHGSIIKHQGYKKNIFYYDHLRKVNSLNEKFQNFWTVPLKSKDRSQDQYLVPDEATLAENKIKKWMNIDYGNTHPEWNASRLINSQNLKELDKIKLRVVLTDINFQVARGFAVPLYVSVQLAEQIFKATESSPNEPEKREVSPTRLSDQVPDAQLTGYYYVSGAKYHYDKMHVNGLYTELLLARREWKPSKKID